jgi:hypothetical protein
MEEISPETLEMLANWNGMAKIIAYAFAGISVLILLGYMLRLTLVKEFKDKYDFINRFEINTLMAAALVLIAGAAFYANAFLDEAGVLIISVRIFVTAAMGLIAALIVQNLLKFYYPFYIEKRLKALRYKPRISPSGRPMKLLSEEEEDVYLDEGMQAEEDVYSVDYDVWIDEESGFTKIEKYAGHLHALQCPECNYQTFKVSKEEIVKAPSATEEGELMKFFECGYCGHKSKKMVKVGMLREASAGA